MTLPELYRKAFDVNGEVTQTIVGVEELSELQKELCKHYRGFDNLDKIAEEAADALMVIFEQIDHLSIHNAVAECFKAKAHRLAKDLGVSNFVYEPPAPLKCTLPDKITIRIDVCKNCGHTEISWMRQDNTEEIDISEEWG